MALVLQHELDRSAREVRCIKDEDLNAEYEYVQREIANGPEHREAALLGRLGCIKDEVRRRTRIKAPPYSSTASYSASEIAAIKANVNIVTLVAEDLELVRQSGGKGYFRCPWHADNHPSFTADAGRWHCFVCNVHGDCFDWLISRRGLSFREALETLK